MFNVFVSSIVGGFEHYRVAASEVISQFFNDLRLPFTITRSDLLPSAAASSLERCERMVAESTLVVGIYGERYGFVDDETGLSITHMEYRWARDRYRKPILAFIVKGSAVEPLQQSLINEIEQFRFGVFRRTVGDIGTFKLELYRALNVHLGRLWPEIASLRKYDQLTKNERPHLAFALAGELVSISPTSHGGQTIYDTVRHLTSSVAQSSLTFVVGETGAGKTWLLEDTFRNLMREYFARGTSLPRWVDLGILRAEDVLSASKIIDRILMQTTTQSNPPIDSQLPGASPYCSGVYLFDGFDEATNKGGEGTKIALMTAIVKILQAGNRGIVSSRSQVLASPGELRRLIEAVDPEVRRLDLDLVTYLRISPLTSHDVTEFMIHQFGKTVGLQHVDAISKIRHLPEIVRRPMALRMVSETIDHLAEQFSDRQATAGSLWRLYSQKWIDREGPRLPFFQADVRAAFAELSLQFHNRRMTECDPTQLADLLPGYIPAARLASERVGLMNAITSCTFLEVSGDGNVRFAHPSFLDYFLAERVLLAARREQADLLLNNFPTKTANSFALDLIAWDNLDPAPMYRLLFRAQNPVVRYLVAYLLNRMLQGKSDANAKLNFEAEFRNALEREQNPVVYREILVGLSAHGFAAEDELVWRHLRNPIPHRIIVKELEDYYGGLEAARSYLREQLRNSGGEKLRLFYLISLAAIREEEDDYLFDQVRMHGNDFERYVVSNYVSSGTG